jgi:hypothetical protein
MYAQLPITFEANRGQSNPRVKFLAHGPGYLLLLTRRRAVLSLQPIASGGASRTADVVHLRFVRPDRAARLTGRERLAAHTNYFLGNDPRRWITAVPNYAQAEYRGLYPGIDALFHGERHRLEFDFVLRPGANPRDIVLRVGGIERMSLDPSGNLVLRVAGARRLVLDKPQVFQRTAAGRREVPGRFVIRAHHELAFALGPYDTARALTIDPTLSYSSLFEGGGVAGMTVDASGKVYIVGSTFQGGIPVFPNPGAYQTVCAACATNTYAEGAAFVAKLDTSQSGAASLIYATYLGPATQNNSQAFGAAGAAIAVDSSGDAYVTGMVVGTAGASSFPTTPGAFLTSMPGATNAFVAELDPTGARLLSSTYLGGNNSGGAGDSGAGIALDTASNVYVTGLTGSPNLATAGAAQTALPGPETPFVAKLDPALSQITYFTYLGGGSDLVEAADAIAVDPAGEAYVVGSTESSAFPAPLEAGFQPAPGTLGQSGFLAKVNSAGSQLAYLTYLGGNPGSGIAVTAINAVALDSSGDAYVTGTAEAGLPTPGSVVGPAGNVCVTANGSTSCPGSFVAEINPAVSGTPSLLWLTYLGGLGPAGANSTSASGIALDASGNVFITGSTGNGDFPLPGISPTAGSGPLSSALPCLQRIPECWSAFLVELSPGATQILYSTYLGGAGGTAGFVTDGAKAIAIDSAGNIDLAGTTTASDGFPVTSNAYDATGQSFGTQSFLATISGVASGQGGNGGAFASYTLNGAPPQLGGLGYVFAVSAPATSTVQVPIVLTNTGGTAMTISQVYLFGSSSSPWVVNGLTCQGVSIPLPIPANSPVSLPPGQSCTIQAAFAPTVAQTGQDEGLAIIDSAPATNANSPAPDLTSGQYVLLGGTGTSAPPPAFATYSINGIAIVQASGLTPATTLTADLDGSASTEVLLTNTGSLPLTVNQVTMPNVAANSPWSITGGTCPSSASPSTTQVVLASQQSCTIDVVFTPTSATSPQDVLLSVADTATGSNLTAASSGSGQAFVLQGVVGQPYADYSAPTGQVSFGKVTVNAPQSQTVTITNTGTGPLDISKVTIAVSLRALNTQSYWSLTQDCNTQSGGKAYPLTIAPGASCDFTFQLDPTAPTASLVALVSFFDDAQQSNLTSTLNGSYIQQVTMYGAAVMPLSGFDYSLTYAPESLAFTSTSAVQGRTVTVTNTGTQPDTITSVQIGGWYAFTLPRQGCTGPNGTLLSLPVTLASEEACTFSFQYDPSVTGATPDTLNQTGPNATVTFSDAAYASNVGSSCCSGNSGSEQQQITLLGPGATAPPLACAPTGAISVSAGAPQTSPRGSWSMSFGLTGVGGDLPAHTYLVLEGVNEPVNGAGTIPTDPSLAAVCGDIPGSAVLYLSTYSITNPGGLNGPATPILVSSASASASFSGGAEPTYQSLKAVPADDCLPNGVGCGPTSATSSP